MTTYQVTTSKGTFSEPKLFDALVKSGAEFEESYSWAIIEDGNEVFKETVTR